MFVRRVCIKVHGEAGSENNFEARCPSVFYVFDLSVEIALSLEKRAPGFGHRNVTERLYKRPPHSVEVNYNESLTRPVSIAR